MKNHILMKSLGDKPRTGVIISCETCNTEFYVKPSWADTSKYCSTKCYTREHLKGRIGSEGQREAMRLRRGILHPNWIKDRTEVLENDRLRHTEELKQWRESVFSRDNFICQDCGQTGGKLEAHHIKPWRDYKDIRHQISNGITLCKICHKKTVNKEYDFIERYSKILLQKLT